MRSDVRMRNIIWCKWEKFNIMFIISVFHFGHTFWSFIRSLRASIVSTFFWSSFTRMEYRTGFGGFVKSDKYLARLWLHSSSLPNKWLKEGKLFFELIMLKKNILNRLILNELCRYKYNETIHEENHVITRVWFLGDSAQIRSLQVFALVMIIFVLRSQNKTIRYLLKTLTS